ncbi:hypothetical protein HID58_039389 [Brassica napus]|uniref:Uncharacterized protein n=1 Tax=Brassica napus TaxID=3708 RepID=A0ABQ8BRW3_BRANA|nr:hypothetical protein HID58_039389 [Brassica napus]
MHGSRKNTLFLS